MTDRGSYRVLLVEDNELDARAMSRALSGEADCAVVRVADLQSGLDAVRAEPFDCILLDLSLPDSDGLISVETMVARSPHCPVVVLTGLDDPDVAIESVERGAQDYLVKSTITPELVARAIRYAVARHSTETELTGVKARLDNMHSREQIARDLHDTVIQRLFATGMSLQAGAALPTRDEVAGRAIIAVEQIDDAIRELREAIFGLHSVGEDESFALKLEELAAGYGDTLGFEPVLRLGDLPALPDEVRVDALAVVREALSNVSRHANATAVTVTVAPDHGRFMVRVIDNGTEDVIGSGVHKDPLSGRGLQNLRSRAEAHGGAMHLDSGPAGGVELTWWVPL